MVIMSRRHLAILQDELGAHFHISLMPPKIIISFVNSPKPQRGSSKMIIDDHRHHHQTGVSRKRFEQTAGTRLVVGYACTASSVCTHSKTHSVEMLLATPA